MGTEIVEQFSDGNQGSNDDKSVVIPISVDENNFVEGARVILKIIRPSWSTDKIKYKLFTDGITNKLVGCFHTPQTISKNCFQNKSEKYSEKDVVLIRIYGNKTDLLIDRKAETRNIKFLQSYGFAPNLFASFKNGLAYEYVPGVTLTPETVIIPKIWQLVAKRLAEMHKLNHGPNVKKNPCLKSKCLQLLSLVPEQFSNSEIQKRFEKSFLPANELKEDFLELYSKLEKLHSPVVFSHNDLLLGNVIYTENFNRVTFIDYEYTDYNFQAFDIGNHFTEFDGTDSKNFERYPSKEFQLEWLRVYLENYHADAGGQLTDDAVEKLYGQVNKFALASHLFWAYWGLIQAEHSSIDFDFIKFAEVRFIEYLRKKDVFLSL